MKDLTDKVSEKNQKQMLLFLSRQKMHKLSLSNIEINKRIVCMSWSMYLTKQTKSELDWINFNEINSLNFWQKSDDTVTLKCGQDHFQLL